MKHISLSTWILLLCSAFFALAFGEENNDDFYFYLGAERMFSPGDKVFVNLSGSFQKRTDVTLQAFRINDPIEFFRDQTNPHSPGVAYDDEGKPKSTIDVRDGKRYKKLKEWTEQMQGQRHWGHKEVSVPVSEKGVYLVAAFVKGKVATTVVIITESGLVLKRSDDQLLAWAVNRTNGHKAPNAKIIFRNGSKVIDARSDANGLALASMDALTLSEEEMDEGGMNRRWGYGSNLVVFGEANGNFFISDSYFYNYWGRGDNGNYRTYFHTDRPVYRPAQTVYYRGAVREVLKDGTYQLLTGKKVVVDIRDSRGGELKKDTLELSDFGTFHGELSLAEEPPLGDYQVQVMVGETAAGYFNFSVEEYKKPEYEVLVKTEKDSYTRGDKITATIKADYYFGSPVSSGTVEYRVLRSRYWRPWWQGTQWASLYKTMPANNPYGSEFVENGQGELNADGTFSFTFNSPADADEDYNYTLIAQVTDASRRTISGSATVRVTRGEFFLTGQTDRYVYKPDEQVLLYVGAWKFEDDKGVATPFSVKLKRTWWEPEGRESREEIVWEGSGSTGADGTGTITFKTPKAGYFTAEISATDKRGNTVTAATSLYVADQSYAWWDNRGGVQIIPDRDLYKPGDMMSALVIMPVEDVDMLLTAEGPMLFSYSVERLSGNSAVIRIPIEERFAPTFFPSVSALVGDRLYSTQAQVTVAPEDKVVTLEITTDKSEYKPGERGTVKVRALNAEGEPMPDVDLAVGLVDEALYAIKPDNTPDIAGHFYGPRWNQVNTSSSLDFRFYSAMRDETETLADSILQESSVAFSDGEFGIRGGRANVASLKRDGIEISDPLVSATVRKDFLDLMFWTPSARTDRSGYAMLPVTFPDNLTMWRITARGITKATQVGQATAKVIARKDLLVRMETPRFITEGDELIIATNVHNYLATEKQVTVEFEATGVKAMFKSKKSVVTIPANGEKRVDWKIKAEEIGTATFTVKALTNEESDAMEMKIPILPQGVKTGTSAIADISEPNGRRDLRLAMLPNGKLETAVMHVSLSPSAASSVLGALDELIGYPYGCVEQTMSRFLPTVVVADVLQDLNVPFDQKKQEELPKMVDQGLKRLATLQHSDGGWGWWENDETNPFMTAYVMYGLTVAQNAGYAISTERYAQGAASLHQLIEQRIAGGGLSQDDKRLNMATEAYMLYVASTLNVDAESNGLVRDRIADLSDEKDLNTYGVALLALAAHEYQDTRLAKSLAGRLIASATETGSSAHWSGAAWHYNWQDDEVETSAAAVKALLKIEGETDLVRKGVRWLLAQKNGSAWHNTRQTAMVIYSLVDYLRASDELNPNYTMIVKVNGKVVLTKKVTKSDVYKTEEQVKVDAAALRKGDNVVTVEKSGEGRLYASARLTYYATGDAIKPGEAGFKVEREYYRLERVTRKGVLAYEKKKITGPVKSGDEIFVRLTVIPERNSEYFIMEDPLPAGCEVIADTDGYNVIGEDGYGDDDNGRGYYRRGWNWGWRWWYADRDVRDEKVAFFATSIDAKSYTLTYIMRAQIPGQYSIMPAAASLMYYPEVRGNSGSEKLAIVD